MNSSSHTVRTLDSAKLGYGGLSVVSERDKKRSRTTINPHVVLKTSSMHHKYSSEQFGRELVAGKEYSERDADAGGVLQSLLQELQLAASCRSTKRLLLPKID